jgi:hypothetical protein
MVEDGRLIAPDEVRREIERGDDPLVDWVKNQRGLFVPVGNDLVAELRRVKEMFPELIDHMKVGPHADALIVALALLINKEPGTLFERRRCIVATNEKGRGQQKIPTACKHFGIEVVDWFGFMELEELEL